MKMIRIIDCSDPMLWYSDSVGATVPLLGSDTDSKGPIYWTREPAGYKNLVFQKDAEIIEVNE